jgi:glycosyltransferase involved in cell wall biosynthesis
MKIAIVAPSPVPFTVGGAENLFWGLQDYFNLETSHQCELMKLPSAEQDLWQILDSYEKFLRHDLSYFDVVISTKYPAWMVKHPRHVCYLQHRLRGLYDTYHFCKQPEDLLWEGAALGSIKQQIQQLSSDPNCSNSAVLNFLASVRALKDSAVPHDTFRFPGPFARQVVHALDSFGLAPGKISRFAAISANVRGRRDYFPAGASVSVVHHPPRLTGYRCGSDDYLFTASRLDGAKRIGLLIQAMQQVRSDIPLLIAGTGPDEQRLRELAGDDARIKFLGFVRDSEMLDYYANALAVPFVPYDEDYGLITIEAMKSAKPVLTVRDSGGPNEFVRDGVSGYSVPPEPAALAERIDYLCEHREATREMGVQASRLVQNITWKAVADGLLSSAQTRAPVAVVRPARRRRRKLVVSTTFPIAPPRGGGQARIYHLYRHLARSVDVEIVSLCNHDEPGSDGFIAPGLREIRVPKSLSHHQQETELSRSVDWIPITDIAMPVLFRETSDYVAALTTAAHDAFAVIASHPYTVGAIQQCAPGKPLWFEAHNVEYALKRELLPQSEAGRTLLKLVHDCEAQAWQRCEVAYACTQTDLDALAALYGPSSALSIEVPNGVNLENLSILSSSARAALKQRLGFESRSVALFMGSWHGPNLTAVEHVLGLATSLPTVIFVILGSAGLAFKERSIPGNVLLAGPLDEQQKSILLSAADIALNPMVSGSGSNLKMLDYAAMGIPILSTPFGARGFSFEPERHYLAAELAQFPLELTVALATQERRQNIAAAAHQLVCSRYSWKHIAKQFTAKLAERIPRTAAVG